MFPMKPRNNIIRKYTSALFILVFSISVLPQERPKGYISGTVTDKATKHPLIGVNVIIENTKMGASTDDEGKYLIPNIPVGTYNLSFSYVGYGTLKKANVVVNSKRHTILEAELEEVFLTGENITITPTYFEKPTHAVVSNRSMDFE